MIQVLPVNSPPAPARPRFNEQVRQTAFEHYNRPEPADRCVDWTRRFILFHNKRHPADMGRMEIGAFLQHLAGTADAEGHPADFFFKTLSEHPLVTFTVACGSSQQSCGP